MKKENIKLVIVSLITVIVVVGFYEIKKLIITNKEYEARISELESIVNMLSEDVGFLLDENERMWDYVDVY